MKSYLILIRITKITATIIAMDYVQVDILMADQLEVGDFILLENEVVSIINISSLADGYVLEIENDFGEREIVDIEEDSYFPLMILQ